MTQTPNEFFGYSPNKFRKEMKGRTVMIKVGTTVNYCRVSKKDFFKCASANSLINGFYFESNPQYVWVNSIN